MAGTDPAEDMFSKLTAADLQSLHAAVETTMDHYGLNLG
jgi:hypothetical protein